jgi:4'-phosphopantetheinyl transferase
MTAQGESWEIPPPVPDLPSDDVQIWRVPLDGPSPVVARLKPLLAPDECARAESFRFERDRGWFIVGRAMLRIVLGRILKEEPDRLEFRYGAQGKPALAGSFERAGLEFNVTHSQGLALVAVTRRRRVGVDIEALRPLLDREQIIHRFFSARERAEFALVPEGLRVEAFYQGWTRKEAYMKALGAGFSLPLDRFEVSLAPGAPARLWNVEERPEEAGRWSFQDLHPSPGFLGAVAVEGAGWRLRCFQADHS